MSSCFISAIGRVETFGISCRKHFGLQVIQAIRNHELTGMDQGRRLHGNQVKIDIELASALVREQFPCFANEEILPLHSAGTNNAVFRIGAGHAARFPLKLMDPETCERRLRSESVAMIELGECCPVPTPQPAGIGRASADYPMPWLLQSWIEGAVATPDGLGGSTIFALDLARLVTSLRAADVKGRRFDGRGRGGHLPDHDDWMEECFHKSKGLLDVARLRRLWSDFRDLPSSGVEVMSHKDLIPANLLVKGERLTGVLDGGDFGPADPALDCVVGWHLLDRERRSIFRNAAGIGELEWARGAAWAFQQAMGLVWFYKETNPAMSALGRSTLQRLLEDADATRFAI